MDTSAYYAFTKFALNNIQNGTIPLWNPFVNLGRPYTFLAHDSIVNPFLTCFIIALKYLGFNYYQAYSGFLLTYYFLGAAGFYLLAKSFFKDDFLGFLSYFILLFSGIGISVFNQVNMLLIFVPCVWFFYFLINFGRSFQKPHFIGMIFCVMIAMNSYLPFYFITLFLVFTVCFVCLYPIQSKKFITGFFNFAGKNVRTIFIGLIAILIAMTPLLLYKVIDAQGESVAPLRHCNSVTQEECLERTLHGTSEMNYTEASGGSLGWRFGFHEQFSSLDKTNYGQDGLFYLPVFCYLIIGVAFFTVFDRKLMLLCATALLLFLIAIADASFFYLCLYDHLFYFKYFRNLFFFMAFLMPLLVLVAVTQLKSILEYKISSEKGRKNVLVTVLFMHLVFFLFLGARGNIIWTSYATVIASAGFFALHFTGLLKKRRIYFVGGLLCLILLQPVQFFDFYRQNAVSFKCDVPYEHAFAKFLLKRPEHDLKSECSTFRHVPGYIEYWHSMMMRDSSGKIGFAANVARWPFLLSAKLDSGTLMNYSRNKLILYDDVAFLDENNLEESLGTLGDTLRANKNLAYISERDEDLLGEKRDGLEKRKSSPLIVARESEQVRVRDFTVNSLKLSTHFDSPKFLVYNDSFNSHWKVFVNDRQQKIYRANMAFKGIYLPSGRNNVSFQYSPPGGEGVYYGVIIFYFLFLMYTLWALRNQRKRVS